jgi:hypothetical protein
MIDPVEYGTMISTKARTENQSATSATAYLGKLSPLTLSYPTGNKGPPMRGGSLTSSDASFGGRQICP